MGKKLVEVKKQIDKEKAYNLNEAVELLKTNSFVKFDETLEISLNLGIDPRHSDQMVRGIVPMPKGTGKKVKVAVICREDKVEAAMQSGADKAGANEIIEEIKDGVVAYDVYIATPDMMGMVGQVARVLGPKGLMPNPKLGTVTADVAGAVQQAKSGQVEFRAEKAGIVHAGVGKLGFKTEDLVENVNSFVQAIIKAKPAGSKGAYLRNMHISSTMGPSLKVDLGQF